jgi:hypothetical protein
MEVASSTWVTCYRCGMNLGTEPVEDGRGHRIGDGDVVLLQGHGPYLDGKAKEMEEEEIRKRE